MEVHLAVDEIVVRRYSDLGEIVANYVFEDIEVLSMVVIIQSDRTQVNVIVSIARSMDYHRTPCTIDVLTRVMRVIPCRTIRRSLETVSVAAAGRYRAHGDSGDTVHPF